MQTYTHYSSIKKQTMQDDDIQCNYKSKSAVETEAFSRRVKELRYVRKHKR